MSGATGPRRMVTKRYVSSVLTLNGAVKLAIDVGLFMIATVMAFAIRYDGTVPSALPVLIALTFSVPIKVLMELVLDLPARSWSNLTFRDLGALFALAAVVVIPGTLLLIVFGSRVDIPPSVALLDGALTLIFMAGVRALVRYRHEQTATSLIGPDFRKRVLVIGAGEAGALTVRELFRHPETGLRPVAFLDD